MKNTIITLILISLLDLLTNYTNGQQELNKPYIKTISLIETWKSTGLKTLTYQQQWQLRKDFCRTSPDEKEENQVVFREMFNEEESQLNTVVLYPTIVEYAIPLINEDGLGSSHVTEKRAFVCLSQPEVSSGEIIFYWPKGTEWFDHASEEYFLVVGVKEYKIHPGDRVSVFINETTEVSLNAGDKLTTLTSGSVLNVTNCPLGVENPDLPPWPITDINSPWKISDVFEGTGVYANAYTLLSSDNVFDKPFLFVEGIDFGYSHTELRNGNFGWCQFITGGVLNNNEYSIINYIPDFLEQIRAMGYDVILVDFYDGACDIRRNAKILDHVIDLCDQYKQGESQGVITGASMGGQVARCTLGKRIQEGKSNCFDMFVSLDSPHQGANIPGSIQSYIGFLSPYSSDAEMMLNQKLNRAAAKQLMVFDYFDSEGNVTAPWKHEEYQSYLNSIPFPSDIKTIAISNGSELGVVLEIAQGAHLMDHHCNPFSFIEGDEFKIECYSMPGSTSHPLSTATKNVIGDFVYTEVEMSLLIDYTRHTHVSFTPLGVGNLDLQPGGIRRTAHDVAQSFNANDAYQLLCGGIIEGEEYFGDHTFVSRTSALDYDQNGESPFNETYSSQGYNEMHSNFSPWVSSLLIEKIVQFFETDSIGNYDDYENFNYGPLDGYIKSQNISNSNHVYVNRYAPPHYSNQNVPFESTSHQEIDSKCGNPLIINEHGQLHIGDPGGSSFALTTVSSGNTIQIQNGGKLWIHKGSKVIVKSGGIIEIQEGGFLGILGELELQKGGKVLFKGGELTFFSEQAKVLFFGGQLVLYDNTILNPSLNSNISGEFVANEEPGIDILYKPGSEINLKGNSEEDVLLRLLEASDFRDYVEGGASFNLQLGKVHFENESTVELNSNLYFEELIVMSTDSIDFSSEMRFAHNQIFFNRVNIFYTKTKFKQSDFRILDSDVSNSNYWEFDKSKIRVENTVVYNTTFHTQKTAPSSISHSHFYCNNGIVGITDVGGMSWKMNDVVFSGFKIGFEKSFGESQINCSEFEKCEIGIRSTDFNKLYMDEGSGNGKNKFSKNGTHVEFDFAGTPSIQKGKNRFDPPINKYFVGTIAAGIQTINATFNDWNDYNPIPNIELYFVTSGNLDPIGVLSFPVSQFTECGEEIVLSPKLIVDDQNIDPSIYPNPVALGTQLLIVNHQVVSWSIYNCLGSLIKGGEGTSIEIGSEFSSGTYFIQINEFNKQSIHRFVVL